MAEEGSGSEADGDELTDLQHVLAERQTECSQLSQLVQRAHAERDAAHRATTAGIAAAKAQHARMKAELQSLADARRRAAAARDAALAAAAAASDSQQASGRHNTESQDSGDAGANANASVDRSVELPLSASQREVLRLRKQSLQLQARELRHELSKWRHLAEKLQAERPEQEAELTRLKAELTHSTDVLQSTKDMVKHHQVERDLRRQGPMADEGTGSVQLFGGGHGSIEALAERNVRERAERRTESLANKAKQLTSVLASQQLLVQRLEKQLLAEETTLAQRESLLTKEAYMHAQLRGNLRKRSDQAVLGSLFPRNRRPFSKASSGSVCPEGAGVGASRSSSTSSLPRIVDAR